MTDTTTDDTHNADDAGEPAADSPSLWHRLRSRRSTRWAMDIAIVVAIILAISAYQSRHLLGDDDPLPPVQVHGLDGTPLSLDELDADRTIIYFWETWCGACDLQASAISALHDPDDEDLKIVSIVTDYDHPGQIAEVVEEEEIDFPVYLGTEATSAAFEVDTLPTIYIVDDEQRIRHGLAGYTTRLGLWLRLRL